MIEQFLWSSHALLRIGQRHLDRDDIERAVREYHNERRANDGQADWLIVGVTAYGARIEVIYDHPVNGDETTALIVSAWRVG